MNRLKLEYWQWFIIVSIIATTYAVVKGGLSKNEIVLFAILLLWLSLLQALKRSKINAEKHAIFLIIRTEKGKGFIEKIGKYKRFWKITGTFMVIVGILGMFFMLFSLLNAIYLTYFKSIPAMKTQLLIPGYTIPLWYGLFAFVTIIVVHEFSHGILSRAENIPIKSLGVFFAFIIPLGAFVEPEEEVFNKKPWLSQLRVYSAGSFANLLLAVIVLFALTPLAMHVFFQSEGVQVVNVVKGSPAYGVLERGDMIMDIRGTPIKNFKSFYDTVKQLKPGKKIKITTERGSFALTLAARKDNPKRGFIGIETFLPIKKGIFHIVHFLPLDLISLFRWVFFLNIIVGLVNLLPIHFGVAATDGHHILRITLNRFMKTARAERFSSAISIFIGLVILINLIKPPL